MQQYFNPRSPHGERPRRNRKSSRSSIFQSTPPHGERHGVAYHDDSQIVFQSTLPAWGATFFFACSECFFNISIHTPRMGSDPPIRAKMTTSHIFQSTPPHGERLTCFLIKAGLINFNPRPPHGERPSPFRVYTATVIFQSTPPAWGAT